jgi:hypothetical protein
MKKKEAYRKIYLINNPWKAVKAFCFKVDFWINRYSNASLTNYNWINCKSKISFIKAAPIPWISSNKWKKDSSKMLSSLIKLQTLRNKNKFWYKLNEEERAILEKMSMNLFKKQLSISSARRIVKKEIWKRALEDIREIKNKNEADKAKQFLFYLRFGSSSKNSNKKNLAQLNIRMIIDLFNYEYYPESFNKGSCSNYETYERGLELLDNIKLKKSFGKIKLKAKQKNLRPPC